MDRKPFDAKIGLDGWWMKYHLQQLNDDIVVALAGALSDIATVQIEAGDTDRSEKTTSDAMRYANRRGQLGDAAERADWKLHRHRYNTSRKRG